MSTERLAAEALAQLMYYRSGLMELGETLRKRPRIGAMHGSLRFYSYQVHTVQYGHPTLVAQYAACTDQDTTL